MDRHSFLEHSQQESGHWWFQARREIITALVDVLRANSSQRSRSADGRDGSFDGGTVNKSRIVEVGCGTGATVGALAGEYDALGADISAHAIEIARQEFPEAEFVVYRGWDDLQASLAQADVVLLLDVLEHVEDDFEFMSHLVDRVRPGCRIIVTVPADPALWSEHDVALFHFRRYTPDRLRRVWEQMPVQQLLLSEFNVRLGLPIRLVRAIEKWVRPINDKTKPVPTQARSNLRHPKFLINGFLRRVFASEKRGLVETLKAGATIASALESKPTAQENASDRLRGISLIAVLERSEGDVCLQTRPNDVSVDQGDPPAFDLGVDQPPQFATVHS